MKAESYDALVVGAGPAGAAAAIHMAAGGARVLLAERARFPRAKLCGEFISPECVPHFERLGVLDSLTGAAGARAVSETVFYAPSGRSLIVPSEWFGATPAGASPPQNALGLSRAEMDARLLARARAVGVEVLEDAHPAGVLTDEAGAVRGVRLSVGGRERPYAARVTLDATGRARHVSRLREREARRARPVERRRAPLVAFKAHLDGARGGERACEIYFYRGGYGGLSPVEGGASNLCFIARARDVRAASGDPERLVRELVMSNRRAAETLAGAGARSGWLSVALEGFGRGAPSPAPGLLAVGDAAAFIDPFTGSGMLMALESGELAAGVVLRGLARGGFEKAGPDALGALARDYSAAYEGRFGARLALCATLRRAAFAPRPVVEAGVLALGASRGLRRRLARATRGPDKKTGARRRFLPTPPFLG